MRTFFYVIFKKFSFRSEQNALFKRDKSEREKDLCSYLMVGEEVNSMEQSSSYVETVVLLSQQKPDDTIEIDLDLDELDATSAELKAT